MNKRGKSQQDTARLNPSGLQPSPLPREAWAPPLDFPFFKAPFLKKRLNFTLLCLHAALLEIGLAAAAAIQGGGQLPVQPPQIAAGQGQAIVEAVSVLGKSRRNAAGFGGAWSVRFRKPSGFRPSAKKKQSPIPSIAAA